MTIYDHLDYRRFLTAQFEQMPRKGHGQARRLAQHLSVHPVVISQILAGDRDFTLEQSLDVASFFGLDAKATDYLSLLILKARAGTKKLENLLSQKIDSFRKEMLQLKNQIPEVRELDETDRAIFYSDWIYSGVRLMTSVEGFNDLDSIAERFQLSRAKVGEIMDYLVSRGLCKADENGRYSAGTTRTFMDAASPFTNGYHRSWRLKSTEQMLRRKANDCYFSIPCSLSKADKDAFREEILKFIQQFYERLGETQPEQLACLNIDWFDF